MVARSSYFQSQSLSGLLRVPDIYRSFVRALTTAGKDLHCRLINRANVIILSVKDESNYPSNQQWMLNLTIKQRENGSAVQFPCNITETKSFPLVKRNKRTINARQNTRLKTTKVQVVLLTHLLQTTGKKQLLKGPERWTWGWPEMLLTWFIWKNVFSNMRKLDPTAQPLMVTWAMPLNSRLFKSVIYMTLLRLLVSSLLHYRTSLSTVHWQL